MANSSSSGSVNIDIKARADAGALDKFGHSLADLQRLLVQAKKDFANSAPGSEQYVTLARNIAQLGTQINGVLAPVRQFAEQEAAAAEHGHRVNAMLSAGINPWTTATSKYREAQAALEAEARAAKLATEEHERLNRAKASATRDMRADAVMQAQRQMAADLREAERSTARLAAAARRVNEEHAKVPAAAAPATAGMRNTGMAALEVSRAFEDAQYGVAGVLNNIPSLVMALGGGMGLAGIISVSAVGITQLVRRFGDLHQAVEDVNLLVQRTPDQEAEEKLRQWRKSIQDTTDTYERQRQKIIEVQKAEEEKAAHEQAIRDIDRRIKELTTGRPEGAADFERRSMADFHDREGARASDLGNAVASQGSVESEAKEKRAAAKKQKDFLGGVANIGEWEEAIRKLREKIREEKKSTAASVSFAEMASAPAEVERATKEGQAKVAALEKEIAGLIAKQRSKKPLDVPGGIDNKDPKENEANYKKALAREQEKLRQLEDEADAAEKKVKHGRDALALKTASLSRDNARDFYDTVTGIEEKKKAETDTQRAYDMAIKGREQPNNIREDALEGLRGIRKDALKRGDDPTFKAISKLIDEVGKSTTGLNADLIVRINAALENLAKRQPEDSAATRRVKGSIEEARKFDDAVRGVPMPEPPNVAGASPKTDATQIQTPGIEATQENLYQAATQAHKDGKLKDEQTLRQLAADLSDGISKSEIDRLQQAAEKMKSSHNESVAAIARSLADTATHFSSVFSSVQAQLARVEQAIANTRLAQ